MWALRAAALLLWLWQVDLFRRELQRKKRDGIS